MLAIAYIAVAENYWYEMYQTSMPSPSVAASTKMSNRLMFPLAFRSKRREYPWQAAR